MSQVPHPQSVQLLTAVRGRLLAQIHSLDPSTAASAEMSKAKADGRYFTIFEAVLGECVTLFDPDELIARACERLGYTDRR